MKIYIANISQGSFDDFCIRPIFASHDEKKVADWVNKFDSILFKLKEYYSRYETAPFNDPVGYIENEDSWIKEEFVKDYFERWYMLREINRALITEIEFR